MKKISFLIDGSLKPSNLFELTTYKTRKKRRIFSLPTEQPKSFD